MGTLNHDLTELQCSYQLYDTNCSEAPPMVRFYIASAEHSGSRTRIHSIMFLAVAPSWKYLMWVDCEIIWRGSRVGITNKACLGLVTRTTGHSLCFKSTNENIPWSTARRRYLQHEDIVCVSSAACCQSHVDITGDEVPWVVTLCSLGRSVQDWRISQARSLVCLTLWCRKWAWYVNQARSLVWLTLRRWKLKWYVSFKCHATSKLYNVTLWKNSSRFELFNEL
jgi:hypothetical protein